MISLAAYCRFFHFLLPPTSLLECLNNCHPCHYCHKLTRPLTLLLAVVLAPALLVVLVLVVVLPGAGSILSCRLLTIFSTFSCRLLPFVRCQLLTSMPDMPYINIVTPSTTDIGSVLPLPPAEASSVVCWRCCCWTSLLPPTGFLLSPTGAGSLLTPTGSGSLLTPTGAAGSITGAAGTSTAGTGADTAGNRHWCWWSCWY